MSLHKGDRRFYDVRIDKQNIFRKYIKENKSLNSVLLTIGKELRGETLKSFPGKIESSASLIKDLEITNEFHGHSGCVNCLDFNEDGRLLVSGSDDTNIILWDPIRCRKIHTFQSRHRGNIFSVKFLPKTDDKYIVSGAGDHRIEVRETSTGELSLDCQCHKERVKRIATIPGCPSVFYSASEDGTVRQIDTREKHTCSPQSNNVLIDLQRLTDCRLEAKCVSVNPIKTEQLAVGATDPFIRVYDKRRLSLSQAGRFSQRRSSSSSIDSQCMQYFTAGNLPRNINKLWRVFRSLATTYISFSPNGKDLLANISGDNIYLFDMDNADPVKSYFLPDDVNQPQTDGMSTAVYNLVAPSNDISSSECSDPYFQAKIDKDLPPKIIKIIASANIKGTPTYEAVFAYNIAIEMWPYSPYLYIKRAEEKFKRRWDSDMYSSLRDIEKALEIDPMYKNALLKKIVYLHTMGLKEAAYNVLKNNKEFSPYLTVESHPVAHLYNTLLKLDSKPAKDGMPVKAELMSPDEEENRSRARDFDRVYLGHCNATTDIKEASFLGSYGDYIAAGSDDGNLFVWDRHSTNLVKIAKGDESILNCVQYHPTCTMLATSGIENVIKLWTPNRKNNTSLTEDEFQTVICENQARMRMSPDTVDIMQMPIPIPLHELRRDFNAIFRLDDSGYDNACRTS